MKKVKGFTLLATVFILVILAMAGLYLMRMGATQQQMINYNLLSTSANHAAMSAMGIALSKWQKNPHQCPEQVFLFDKTNKALNGFEVRVTCQKMLSYPTEHPTFYTVELQALATRGQFGERDFVSQKLVRRALLTQGL
jgi:hypothetical protein